MGSKKVSCGWKFRRNFCLLSSIIPFRWPKIFKYNFFSLLPPTKSTITIFLKTTRSDFGQKVFSVFSRISDKNWKSPFKGTEKSLKCVSFLTVFSEILQKDHVSHHKNRFRLSQNSSFTKPSRFQVNIGNPLQFS